MSEKVFCEKCGAEMHPIDPAKPIGMICPKCGWGWATSYIDPIAEDAADQLPCSTGTRYRVMPSRSLPKSRE